MAGYTYPTNPLPPSQDQPVYPGYVYPTNSLPTNPVDNQWNQPGSFVQPTSYHGSYDQQNTYNSNPQFNHPAPDNSYSSYGGGYNQMKKNDGYNKGGNSNFRGNNPGNNRNSGQGFNKGPRNFGAPSGMEEQHDTIFVSGISENTTEEELRDFFGSIGLIKMDKKTRKPKIWVYKDKETGKPKGEVTITYDDPPTATSAINWFNGKELNGAVLKVELAQRKNNFIANKNNNNRNSGDRGNDRGNDRGGNRGGNRDFDKSTNNDRGGNTQSREGDWKCTNCMNNNFAWRNSCNRCKTEKSTEGGSSNNGGDRRNNSLPYERRDNNRSFGGGQRNNGGNRNSDHGGFSNRNSDRGGQRGGRNGGPMRSGDNRRSGPY